MTDENGNTLKYTKMQRRIDTYAKKKRQIIMKSFQENNIKQIEEQLNQTCSMSCNYEKFVEYLAPLAGRCHLGCDSTGFRPDEQDTDEPSAV